MRANPMFGTINLEDFVVKPIGKIPTPKKHIRQPSINSNNELIPTEEEYNTVVDEIVSSLPHKNIWPLSGEDGDKYETDYPDVTREMLSSSGSDRSPIQRRAVWIIGNMVFFKRHTDSTRINVGFFKKPEISPYPFWEQAFTINTWKSLFSLRDLIKSKDISDISQKDILEIINLKIE